MRKFVSHLDDPSHMCTFRNMARSMLKFPQLCLKADRLSTYRSFGRPLEEALKFEFDNANTKELWKDAGAGRYRFFKKKVGRHGSYAEFQADSKL